VPCCPDERLVQGCLALFAILLLVAVHHGSAAVLESFTANPEMPPPNFNKDALLLWTTLRTF
jgi:hypothetical protein